MMMPGPVPAMVEALTIMVYLVPSLKPVRIAYMEQGVS